LFLPVRRSADPVAQADKGEGSSRPPQEHLEETVVVLEDESMGVAGNP
jgi:hypothetical protein